MLVKNLRYQFYEVIKHQRILWCDTATYTLRPANSRRCLVEAINKHKNQTRVFILINCVGSMSIPDLDLELANETAIFVLETRRPVNLDNIYSQTLVRVLVRDSEVDDWKVPEPALIYEPPDASDNEEGSVVDGAASSDDDRGVDENDGSSVAGSAAGSARGVGNGIPFPFGGPSAEKRPRSSASSLSGRLSSAAGFAARRRQDITSKIERRALKRQRRTAWKQNRANLIWKYYLNSWHAAPVSLMMLELAHELGHSDAEVMWFATVGLSSMLADHLISLPSYTDICIDRMRNFIRKYAPRANVSAEQSKGDDQLRISFDNGLLIPLYEHWTLRASMTNDMHFLCQCRWWSQKGEHNYRNILVKLGIPLLDSQKSFSAHFKDRRKEIFDALWSHLNDGFCTFTSHIGYNVCYTAIDFARVLALQLEYNKNDQQQVTSPNTGFPFNVIGNSSAGVSGGQQNIVVDVEAELINRFVDSQAILQKFARRGGRNVEELQPAIKSYKSALQAINGLVCRSIQQGHVISAARFFVINVHQSPVIPYLINSRHCLFLFTNTILRAFAATRANRRSKPLVVAVPMGESAELERSLGIAVGLPNQQYLMITGIMPLSEIITDPSQKSMVGRAFEHVAEEARIPIQKHFDANIVVIRAEDRLKFFTSLEARLEIV